MVLIYPPARYNSAVSDIRKAWLFSNWAVPAWENPRHRKEGGNEQEQGREGPPDPASSQAI